tara:strand:- start:45170 stop:45349 length:180 start_codon:yes stop_codon:yes gene_type:complete
MKETNQYKIQKLGCYWHLMRMYYVGWWIFKEDVWLSEFPYYWYKEDAENALDNANKRTK